MKFIQPSLRVIIFSLMTATPFCTGTEFDLSTNKKIQSTLHDHESLRNTLKLAHVEPLILPTSNIEDAKELKIFNKGLKELQEGLNLYEKKDYKNALPTFLQSLNNVEKLNKDHNSGIFSKLQADLKHAIFCSTFALERDPLAEYMQNCMLDLSFSENNPSIAMGFNLIGQAYAASKSLNTDIEQLHLNHAYDLLSGSDLTKSIDCIAAELKPLKAISTASTLYKQKSLMNLLKKFASDDNIHALSTLIKIFIKKEYNQSCSDDDMLDWYLTYILQFAQIPPQNIPQDHPIIQNTLLKFAKTQDDDGTILLTYLEFLHADKRNNSGKMKDAITRLSFNQTRQPVLELLRHTPTQKILKQILNYLPTDENLMQLFDSDDFILIPLLEEKLLSLANTANSYTDAINWILGLYKHHNKDLKNAHENFKSCIQYKKNLRIRALCLETSDSIQQFLGQFEQIIPLLQQSNDKKSDRKSKEMILATIEEFYQKYMPTLAFPHAYRMIFCMAQLPEMYNTACDEFCATEETLVQEPRKDYKKTLPNKHRIQIYELLEKDLQKENTLDACKTLIRLDRIHMDYPYIDNKDKVILHKNIIRHGSCMLKDSRVPEENKTALKAYYKKCASDYAKEDNYDAAYHLILCMAQMPQMQQTTSDCFIAVEELLIQEPQNCYKKIRDNEDRIQIYELLKKSSLEPQNLSLCTTMIDFIRTQMCSADIDDKSIINLQQDLVQFILYALRKPDLSDGEKNRLESLYEQSTKEHIKAGRYVPAYHMIACMAERPKMQLAACNKLILLEELLAQEPQNIYQQLLYNTYRMQAYQKIEIAAQKTPLFFFFTTLIDLCRSHIEHSPIDEIDKISLQEKMLNYLSCGFKLKQLSPENETFLKSSCTECLSKHIKANQYNLAYHMVFGMLQLPQMQDEAINCFAILEEKLAKESQETYKKLKTNKYRTQAQEVVQRLYKQSHKSCVCKAQAALTATQIAFADGKELISLKKNFLGHLSCLAKHSDTTEKEKMFFLLKRIITSIDIAKQEKSAENYEEAIGYYKRALKDIPYLAEDQEILIPRMHSAIGKCALTIGTHKEADGKFTQAIKWYDEAIQYANPSALYYKARTLLKSNSSKRSWEQIEKLLLQHTETNDSHDIKALSHDKLGAYYYNEKNFIPAFIHLKQAADLKNFSSTHGLIQLCFDGIPNFLQPNNTLALFYIDKTIAANCNISHTNLLLSRAYHSHQKNNYEQSLKDIAAILLSDKSTHSQKAGAMWLNAMIELHITIDITTDMVNSMRTADIHLKKNSSLDEKSIAKFLEITLKSDIDLISNRIQGIVAGNKCDFDALDFCLITGKLLWECARQDITAHELRKVAIQGLKHAAEHGHIESQLFLLNAQEYEVSQYAKIRYLESSLHKQPNLTKIIQPILDGLYPTNILGQATLMRHIIINNSDPAVVKNCITKLYKKCLPKTEIPETSPGQQFTHEQIEELVANLLKFFIKENPLLQAAEQFKRNPTKATVFERNSAILLGTFFTWCADKKILIQGASYLDPICKHKLVEQQLGAEIATCMGTIYFKLGVYFSNEETRNWPMAVLYFKQSTLYRNTASMAILGELWLANLPQTRDIGEDLIWLWLQTAHAEHNDEDTALLIKRFLNRKIEMLIKKTDS